MTGYYHATKYAVEGLSESLWQKVEPLGIKVMLVEPSGFRADWPGQSANESKPEVDDYTATAGARISQLRGYSGKQPGYPVRAAHAIVDAVESPNPPQNFLLGNAAYDFATAKLDALRKEFSAWEAISRRADFPEEIWGRLKRRRERKSQTTPSKADQFVHRSERDTPRLSTTLLPFLQSSPHSATKRGCGLSRGFAINRPARSPELTDGHPITRQAITKHLQVLESVGVVRGEMAGRLRLFELNPEPLLQAKDYLNLVSAQWDKALARLKAHVEPPR